jgi:hypothetical protein
MDAADADEDVRKENPKDLPCKRCINIGHCGIGRASPEPPAPIPKGGKIEKPPPHFESGRGRRAAEGTVSRSSAPKFHEAGRGTVSSTEHPYNGCLEAVARVSQGLFPPPFWMSNGVLSNVTV